LKERLALYAISWLSAWSLVWGGFYVLLSRDINYISEPVITALYFSIATVAVSFLGRSLLLVRRDLFGPGMLVIPGLVCGLGVIVYVSFPVLFSPPTALILQNPDMFFLPLNLRYLVSKLFDITFQQTLILLLVVTLARAGLSLKGVCLLCCILFGGPHLYLVNRNGILFGGYFFAFSLLAGVVFPYAITRYRLGLSYTFSLHLFFYVFTGVLCWLWPSLLSS
jgi:hypothetical protein